MSASMVRYYTCVTLLDFSHNLDLHITFLCLFIFSKSRRLQAPLQYRTGSKSSHNLVFSTTISSSSLLSSSQFLLLARSAHIGHSESTSIPSKGDLHDLSGADKDYKASANSILEADYHNCIYQNRTTTVFHTMVDRLVTVLPGSVVIAGPTQIMCLRIDDNALYFTNNPEHYPVFMHHETLPEST